MLIVTAIPKRPFTAAEDTMILERRARAVTFPSIARAMNRTPGSVRCRHDVLVERRERTRIRAKRLVRACMTCHEPFRSEGAHNRLCQTCRGISASPFEPNTGSFRRDDEADNVARQTQAHAVYDEDTARVMAC